MGQRRRPSPSQDRPAAGITSTAAPSNAWRDHALTAVSLFVLLLAMVRCLVPFTVNLYWETDPRQAIQAVGASAEPSQSPEEQTGIPVLFFGPTGAVILDTLSVFAAAVALVLHRLSGGRWRTGSLLCALIGIGFAFHHAYSSLENAYLCGSWIGAVSLAVAALHLAQRPRQRRWFIAAFIALLIPLAVDATRFVFIDHAQTLEVFKQTEESFLASRGWTKGSPEYEMYLRRMSFVEPTGAFTFSNILGSVAGALALLAAGVAAGLWMRRRDWRRCWMLPAAVTLVGLWIVYLTHSKGAPVAMLLAASLMTLAWWSCRHPSWRRVVPPFAVVLLLAAILLVVIRGLIGPPSTADGERSLLFRFHYWQAATRILIEQPANVITGIGPTQFAEDYNWAKNPLNPEEVRSTHSLLFDNLVMLGVGGVLLCGLLVTWLMQSARLAVVALADESAATQDHRARPNFNVAPIDMVFTIAFVAALFGIDFLIRGPSYATPERFLIWSAGMIGALFILSVLPSAGWLDHPGVQSGLVGAAAALLIHAQIEMTYFQASSAPIAWLVVAVAAAQRRQHQSTEPHAPSSRAASFVYPSLFLLLSLLMLLTLALPVTRQQSLLARAERSVRQAPASWQAFEQTLALLEQSKSHGPFNTKPYEWRARLALEAAAGLASQLKGVPPDKVRPETKRRIDSLLDIALKDMPTHDRETGATSLTLLRQAAQMWMFVGDLRSDPQAVERSISLWRTVIDKRPYVWADRIELADILWRTARKDEAREQYRHAMSLSDAMYLEPTRMMPALERQRIERRLAEP